MHFFPISTGFFSTLSGFGLVIYILRSIAVQTMAKNTGIQRPWFAWVPLLHEYQCARMADRARGVQSKTTWLTNATIILGVGGLGLGFLGSILEDVFLVGSILDLAFGAVSLLWMLLVVLTDYWLYIDFEPENTILYTVLSVVGLGGVSKFLIRNNVPVGVAGRQSGKQPKYSA